MAIRKLPLDQPCGSRRGTGFAVTLIGVKNVEGKAPVKLLNVSYDPTRDLYRDLDASFTAGYEKASGRPIKVQY